LISSIITILSALFWYNERRLRKKEQLTRPVSINFSLKYLNQTAAVMTAWNDIWSKMLPVCEIGNDGKPKEIESQFAEDAQGALFFAPRKIDGGKIYLYGYGYYTETMKTESGAGVPLTCAVKCQSSAPIDVSSLDKRIEIPVTINQHGLGNNNIEFNTTICLESGKVCSRELSIFYHGTHIATAIITDTTQLQLN
jgi:hypothetical protein